MKVLFATDGTRTTESALKTIEKLLQSTTGVALTVLYVSNAKIPYYHETPLGVQEDLPLEEQELVNQIENRIRARLYPWRQQVKFRHAIGQPATTICKVASDEGVDLIICGTRSTPVKRMGIGSVSRFVLSHATAPVLIAR